MEPMDDAARPVEGGVLAADCPVAGQPPLVELRTASLIDMTGILNSTAGRNEVPGLVVADIGFGRAQVGQIGRSLSAFRVYRNRFPGHHRSARFGKKLLDHTFRPVVLTFAEFTVPDAPRRIDE